MCAEVDAHKKWMTCIRRSRQIINEFWRTTSESQRTAQNSSFFCALDVRDGMCAWALWQKPFADDHVHVGDVTRPLKSRCAHTSQKYQQQYIALDNKPARWARLLFWCQCGIRSVKVPPGWTRVPWRLYWLPLKCGPTWNYLSIGIYRLFCKVYATIQRHKTVIAYCWFCSIPANTKHLYDMCIMLVQRRRRWATLYKCYTNVLCLLGWSFVL